MMYWSHIRQQLYQPYQQWQLLFLHFHLLFAEGYDVPGLVRPVAVVRPQIREPAADAPPPGVGCLDANKVQNSSSVFVASDEFDVDDMFRPNFDSSMTTLALGECGCVWQLWMSVFERGDKGKGRPVDGVVFCIAWKS